MRHTWGGNGAATLADDDIEGVCSLYPSGVQADCRMMAIVLVTSDALEGCVERAQAGGGAIGDPCGEESGAVPRACSVHAEPMGMPSARASVAMDVPAVGPANRCRAITARSSTSVSLMGVAVIKPGVAMARCRTVLSAPVGSVLVMGFVRSVRRPCRVQLSAGLGCYQSGRWRRLCTWSAPPMEPDAAAPPRLKTSCASADPSRWHLRW